MLRKLSERVRSGERGFSLIELLVVVLIIGILAAIALPLFLGQRGRGQDASAKSDARNMVSALESCYAVLETYVGCGATQDVVESGITTGSGAGQVDLAALNSNNFRIEAESRSGNTFTITGPAGGAFERTCTTTGKGSCPSSGNW